MGQTPKVHLTQVVGMMLVFTGYSASRRTRKQEHGRRGWKKILSDEFQTQVYHFSLLTSCLLVLLFRIMNENFAIPFPKKCLDLVRLSWSIQVPQSKLDRVTGSCVLCDAAPCRALSSQSGAEQGEMWGCLTRACEWAELNECISMSACVSVYEKDTKRLTRKKQGKDKMKVAVRENLTDSTRQ